MKLSFAVLAFTLLLTGSPCVRASNPGESAGESAALAWLALIDSGNYSASWSAAASLFRKRMSRSQWQAAAAGVRSPLGALKSRKVQSATFMRSVPGAPAGKYVIVTFASSFENKAAATETVIPMLDSDGAWRVSGYYIR
jgi:hypothetical protein